MEFPYVVGQAVAVRVSGPVATNGTVIGLDEPSADGYRRVHVTPVGEDTRVRTCLVSPSGACDDLRPDPMRPTVGDDRATPDERYTVTSDSGTGYVTRFTGVPIGEANTEAGGWHVALMHPYEAGRQAYRDGVPCTPGSDATVRAIIGDRPTDAGVVTIMDHWTRGWHREDMIVELSMHGDDELRKMAAACSVTNYQSMDKGQLVHALSLVQALNVNEFESDGEQS